MKKFFNLSDMDDFFYLLKQLLNYVGKPFINEIFLERLFEIQVLKISAKTYSEAIY